MDPFTKEKRVNIMYRLKFLYLLPIVYEHSFTQQPFSVNFSSHYWKQVTSTWIRGNSDEN